MAHSLSCWTDRVARVANSLSSLLSSLLPPPPTVAKGINGSGKLRVCLQIARRNQVRPASDSLNVCVVLFD